MNSEQFMAEVSRATARSRALLKRKESEYSIDEDRLIQFKQMAAVSLNPPTKELFSLAMKHVTSLAGMVQDPHIYTRKQWNEKLDDLRNYTFLLDALLTDQGIE